MRNRNKILSLANASTAMPRALCGTVRGEKDPAALFADLRATVEAHHNQQNSRLGAIEATVDSALVGNAAAKLGLGGRGSPEDPEYSGAFASYVRHGASEEDLRKANAEGMRSQIHAAMKVGTNSDGGYLAPVEWDRMVHRQQRTLSPLRRIARQVTTGVAAFSTVWNDGNWGSGWVGEEAARPQTSTPTLATLEFASGEIYANAAITQRLLDDSEIDLDEWLGSEIADEFARQEEIAFLSGDGVNKPFGLLTYIDGGAADGRHPGGNLEVVNSGSSSNVTADGLVDFAYSLPAPYRVNATWLMSSTTAATISKLKDGDGNYVWRESYKQGDPATLLGYPVEIDEGMPPVAADSLPIAFGNFNLGYLINDRVGLRVLRDPYTNKPFVNFYTTKRVGGGVLDPHAIRLLKIAA